jgi:nucleoside-diphosphate-sugar epimerase
MEEYTSPYDISKRRGEEIVLEANREGVIATCSLRAGGVLLSPWDFAMRNLWPIIPGVIMQPLGATIDFIDGRDVVRGMLMAAQALETRPEGVAGEAFWLTKGWSTSAGEVSRLAADMLGYPWVQLPDAVVEPVRFFAWIWYLYRLAFGLRIPGVPPHRFFCMAYYTQTFDNSKVQKTLGFQPKVALKDCVHRIVDLYIRETGASIGPRRCVSFVVTSLLTVVALLMLYIKASLAVLSIAS